MKRNPKKTQKEILSAGLTEFAEKGIAGARMDNIAHSAHVNKALIYHYFGNKEHFYRKILHTQLEKVYQSLQIREKETLIETLKAGIAAYFDYCMEHPKYVSLMLWEMVNGWSTLNVLSSEINHSIQSAFITIIEEGKEKGIFYPTVDSRFFVSIGILQVFCSFLLFNHPDLLKKGKGGQLSSKEKTEYKQQLIESILRSVVKDCYLYK